MKMETPIARVRGLGSSHHGAGHWWAVRANSLALVILYVWLGVSLFLLPSFDHETVVEWLAAPIAAVPMLLLIVATFWHISHGVQENIDDYITDEGWRLFLTLTKNFTLVAVGAATLFALLKIAFVGSVGE